MLRSVALARELEALGASFVVVGSTAQALRGRDVRPADLDVVVHHDDVDALACALQALGGDLTSRRVLRCRDVHVDTAWGPLDVFVAAHPAAALLTVAGTRLRVAA